ncbi:hypothetical protein MNBD_PLANCTO03-1829, partial [hydrothermal vent metagenome]
MAVLYSTMARRATNTSEGEPFPPSGAGKPPPLNKEAGLEDRGAGFPAREGTPPWHLAIDTGGTFTDCLATDPLGNTHRAKVLSSGSLRATICKIDSPTRLCLEAPWLDTPAFALGATLTDPATAACAT